MKTKILTLITSILALTSMAQKKYDLVIDSVHNYTDRKYIHNYSITICKGNDTIPYKAICQPKKDSILLDFNSLYAITFSAKGYLDKTIIFDLRNVQNWDSSFYINPILLNKSDIDTSYLLELGGLPATKIYYDPNMNDIMPDTNMTKASNIIIKNILISSDRHNKDREIDHKNKEIIKHEKYRLYQEKKSKTYLLIGLFLIGIAALSLLLIYNKNRKLAKLTILQKSQVEKQKHTIEEKQKDLLDSIRYAQRIQKSFMTSEKYMEKALSRLRNNC